MPLAKFCSFCGPINISYCIQDDRVLDTSGDALTKWLYQDRFELNVEFVREIIKRLPGIHACSKYEFLNKRTHNSILQTVRSGLLPVKRKSEAMSSNIYTATKPLVQKTPANEAQSINFQVAKLALRVYMQ